MSECDHPHIQQIYLNGQIQGLAIISSVASDFKKMPEGLAVFPRPMVKPSGLQLVPLSLKVNCNAVIVLRSGIGTNNVSKEIHFCMLLCKLECLVDALADHEELDGTGEVAELQEEPRHHLGAFVAPSLLNNPYRILRVVKFVKIETNL